MDGERSYYNFLNGPKRTYGRFVTISAKYFGVIFTCNYCLSNKSFVNILEEFQTENFGGNRVDSYGSMCDIFPDISVSVIALK